MSEMFKIRGYKKLPPTPPEPFWVIDKNNKYIINQRLLIDFLYNQGFVKLTFGEGYKFGRIIDNEVRIIEGTHMMIEVIRDYLRKNDLKALDVFSNTVPKFFATKKLELLPSEELPTSKDTKDLSYFYFKDKACIVSKNKIDFIDYDSIGHHIWESSIIDKSFDKLSSNTSDFYKFLEFLCDGDKSRLLSLQTSLGYLLHNYQDSNNSKAVIFVDENISTRPGANGGSGKSLLIKALSKLRNVVNYDGKSVNFKSQFLYQKINIHTKIIHFEDVVENFKFEQLYNTITADLSIEKKGKTPFVMPSNETPKVVVTSNYIVKGEGGDSEKRRRCDFEVHNHYNANHQPIDDFGKLFFEEWDAAEWSSFFTTMLKCVQLYLLHGLKTANPINIKTNSLLQSTSKEFVNYCDDNLIYDTWINKNDFYNKFQNENPKFKDMSSRGITYWLIEYAKNKGFKHEPRTSGSVSTFKLEKILTVVKTN